MKLDGWIWHDHIWPGESEPNMVKLALPMTMSNFAALPGFYRLLFLYLEPLSTVAPALIVFGLNGPEWFFHQFIPSTDPVPTQSLDPRVLMAIWQLTNCYFLLGLISSFVFRAIRDALPDNPAAQERILGASFLALGIADLTHIIATVLGLPQDLTYTPSNWNSTTHGNITVVIVLFLFRAAWFMGIGRTRYYYGKPRSEIHESVVNKKSN